MSDRDTSKDYTVRNDELEELVEQFRENRDECHDYWQETNDPEFEGKAAAYSWCVNRLNEVIDDE